jgi:hypothetical protein
MIAWLKKYKIWIAIPFVLLGVICVWSWFNKKPAPEFKKELGLELEIIQGRAEAAKIKAASTAALATEQIKQKYADDLRKLDEKQQARIKELEGDPEALTEAILRSIS